MSLQLHAAVPRTCSFTPIRPVGPRFGPPSSTDRSSGAALRQHCDTTDASPVDRPAGHEHSAFITPPTDRPPSRLRHLDDVRFTPQTVDGRLVVINDGTILPSHGTITWSSDRQRQNRDVYRPRGRSASCSAAMQTHARLAGVAI